jgi:hypothetical protein
MSTDKERLEQLEVSYRKLWDEHIALKEAIQKNYAEFKEIRERMGIPEASSVKPAQVEVPQEAVSRQEVTPPIKKPDAATKPSSVPEKSSWEQYIGEQLLSKIGIAVLVIGVGIGAKYAIDHNMLSPAMRIAGGYMIAAILGFFAYRFREKYTGFSAVLVSGAMATTYFMTYAAHIFYHLYPYGLTFALLLLTTIATVFLALRYNLVVIAHFGLVGAYILPALITKQSSHISNYLIYIAVINAGILVIAFMRNWKSLFHIAFGWTTLVMIFWLVGSFGRADSALALFFVWLFFLQFHSMALIYPLVRKQPFNANELWMIVPNSIFLFFAGTFILENADGPDWKNWVFGLSASVLFGGLWVAFKSVRKEDKLLQEVHFLSGISLLTLTLLFQLDQDALFPVLALESVVLGWIVMRSGRKILDIIAMIVLWMSAVYFLLEWSDQYRCYGNFAPFVNGTFVKFLGTLAACGIAFHYIRRETPKETTDEHYFLKNLPAFVLSLFYLALSGEINAWFIHYRRDLIDSVDVHAGGVHNAFRDVVFSQYMVQIGFALCYAAFVIWLLRFYLRVKEGYDWLSGLTISFVQLSLLGMTAVSELGWDYFHSGSVFTLYLFGRYMGIGGMILLWWWLIKPQYHARYLPFIHLAALWLLSLEMIQWLNLSGNQNSYKLSLSILWALYAVYILYVGIRKQLVSLRVIAISILGITLVKLFFYDIARLSTISKTIVFIAVGALLLIGAYFYQRFKNIGEQKQE